MHNKTYLVSDPLATSVDSTLHGSKERRCHQTKSYYASNTQIGGGKFNRDKVREAATGNDLISLGPCIYNLRQSALYISTIWYLEIVGRASYRLASRLVISPEIVRTHDGFESRLPVCMWMCRRMQIRVDIRVLLWSNNVIQVCWTAALQGKGMNEWMTTRAGLGEGQAGYMEKDTRGKKRELEAYYYYGR